MSQDLPVTSYALLGLLTFGDALTAYELKQRADVTLRFYWVSPATSQVYSELGRLAEHGLVAASTRPDDGRDVTTYAITGKGRAALRSWLDDTPTGFPVLKHPVLLRLFVGHVAEPGRIEEMLEQYLDELGSPRPITVSPDTPIDSAVVSKITGAASGSLPRTHRRTVRA
jgi:DNA-binding PadR family transcriptional regulator